MLADGLLPTTPFSQECTPAGEYSFSCYTAPDTALTHTPREELKEAGPRPGGFRCVLEKESADILFYSLTLDGKIVWASGDEWDVNPFV